ncbi:MAG: dTDP-4-dehydrorhamnose reductase [Sphingobacteriales bacterium]|jgi:dTDP-4-dehydrorhamnose reductase
MKKTILITGSNGLLGQKLIKLIAFSPDYDLIATSVGENRFPSVKGYTYHSLDITNPQKVKECFAEFQPQVVINTAAMTNVDSCEDNQDGCWDLNVNAVDYLVTESNKCKAHFIHLSTDFIFDGEEGPYAEDSFANPLSFYGKSKLASEEIVKNKCHSWAIARTILVYGICDNMSRSNIVLWAREALKNGKPINIVMDQFRTPTLAEDLAAGCKLLMDSKTKGVFNIGGDDFMSILELVERIADFYKLDKSIINSISSDTLNQRAQRPKKTGILLEHSKKILGYKPHSFEEGLEILEIQSPLF